MFSVDELARVPGGQTVSAVRSRILLGLLAEEEAARLALPVTATAVEAMAAFFRQEFDLARRTDVEAFLDFAGLGLGEFSSVMRTFRTVVEVQQHHAARIEALLPRYGKLGGSR